VVLGNPLKVEVNNPLVEVFFVGTVNGEEARHDRAKVEGMTSIPGAGN
jgi:hypothetical protein